MVKFHYHSLYKQHVYDSNFCFDIWHVTNADYLLTYLCQRHFFEDQSKSIAT